MVFYSVFLRTVGGPPFCWMRTSCVPSSQLLHKFLFEMRCSRVIVPPHPYCIFSLLSCLLGFVALLPFAKSTLSLSALNFSVFLIQKKKKAQHVDSFWFLSPNLSLLYLSLLSNFLNIYKLWQNILSHVIEI